MTAATLNTQHIRDFLDYIEAEAFLGVHDRTKASEPPRRYVEALQAFMGTYHVCLPLVLAPTTTPPMRRRKFQEAILQDWRAQRDAMHIVRPLFDLLLAVAEQRPGDETDLLYRASFPRTTDQVTVVLSAPDSTSPGERP